MGFRGRTLLNSNGSHNHVACPLSRVQVLECHSFICKTEKAAMALVHACTHAYEHKEGWVDGEPSINLYSSRNNVVGIGTHLPHLVSY